MSDLYWHLGKWATSPPLVLSPIDHSFWLGSTVFDGARRIKGKVPDLRAHCERLIKSAHALGMAPSQTSSDVIEVCLEGLGLIEHSDDIYIRPAMHLKGAMNIINFDPENVELTVSLIKSPTPFMKPFSACLVPFRRPAPDMAVADAKSASLYPSSLRALAYAKKAGFDNAVLCDGRGQVSEFASANIFMVSNETVITPRLTGSFLNGITRRRVIDILNKASISVLEVDVSMDDLLSADEIFLTGNFSQIQPCFRIGRRELPHNPTTRHVGSLYEHWLDSLPTVSTLHASTAE